MNIILIVSRYYFCYFSSETEVKDMSTTYDKNSGDLVCDKLNIPENDVVTLGNNVI